MEEAYRMIDEAFCRSNDSDEGMPTAESMLEKLQHDSFRYFLKETNVANGLVKDKLALNWPASIAATSRRSRAKLVRPPYNSTRSNRLHGIAPSRLLWKMPNSENVRRNRWNIKIQQSQ